MIMSCSTIFRMRNFWDISCRENQNIHITSTPPFFFYRNSSRSWDNVEKYCRVGQTTYDNITRRMRIACCILKATDTRSEYVILTAFPRQKWLRERASMLNFTYIARLDKFNFSYTQNVMFSMCDWIILPAQPQLISMYYYPYLQGCW